MKLCVTEGSTRVNALPSSSSSTWSEMSNKSNPVSLLPHIEHPPQESSTTRFDSPDGRWRFYSASSGFHIKHWTPLPGQDHETQELESLFAILQTRLKIASLLCAHLRLSGGYCHRHWRRMHHVSPKHYTPEDHCPNPLVFFIRNNSNFYTHITSANS